MERSSPQIYIIIQASNEILSNMKVEDIALTFLKSPRTSISYMWLASYDQIIVKKFWTSKWDNFHTIWPNWVGFLATISIWHALSKSFIAFHQNSSHKKCIFKWINLNFGGKKGYFEKYAQFSLQTHCNGLKTGFLTCFKWIFAQQESWRSCSHLSKTSKNIHFSFMVAKLWSNHW